MGPSMGRAVSDRRNCTGLPSIQVHQRRRHTSPRPKRNVRDRPREREGGREGGRDV